MKEYVEVISNKEKLHKIGIFVAEVRKIRDIKVRIAFREKQEVVKHKYGWKEKRLKSNERKNLLNPFKVLDLKNKDREKRVILILHSGKKISDDRINV